MRLDHSPLWGESNAFGIWWGVLRAGATGHLGGVLQP